MVVERINKMIFGKYYSAEGIYEIGGKFLKPRWFANLTKIDVMEAKTLIETGYDASPAKRSKTILLAGIAQWERVLHGGFGDWYAMAALHCYDSTVNAGTCPEWAGAFLSSNNFVIHEYAPTKIVYMRPEADLYMYFKDSPEPVVVPPVVVPPVVTPPIEEPGSTTGGITIPASIDIHIDGIPNSIDVHIWDHSKPKMW